MVIYDQEARRLLSHERAEQLARSARPRPRPASLRRRSPALRALLRRPAAYEQPALDDGS